MYHLSELGKPWLATLEGGIWLKPYQDGNDIWTIGIGNTTLLDGQAVKSTTRLPDVESAIKLYNGSLVDYESEVYSSLNRDGDQIRPGINVSQNVIDALIAFCYNIGCRRFRESTAAKRFNQGFSMKSVSEAMAWFKRPNLTNRRIAESLCMLDGKYVDQRGRPTPDSMKKIKVIK